LAGGLIATFTVTPALCAVLLPEHVRESETWVVHVLHRLYTPTLRYAVANKFVVVTSVIILLALAGVTVRSLGLEFLPKLEEGNLWVRATLPSTISLDEGNSYVNRMRTAISGFPEVESVVSQHGRPDDGTDAAGFFNAEFFAPLKPIVQWRIGLDKDGLTNEIVTNLWPNFPASSSIFRNTCRTTSPRPSPA
jgi:cobalt-zinc-cadmium resistance protein CzcA